MPNNNEQAKQTKMTIKEALCFLAFLLAHLDFLWNAFSHELRSPIK